jgi:hypothetical protein
MSKNTKPLGDEEAIAEGLRTRLSALGATREGREVEIEVVESAWGCYVTFEVVGTKIKFTLLVVVLGSLVGSHQGELDLNEPMDDPEGEIAAWALKQMHAALQAQQADDARATEEIARALGL